MNGANALDCEKTIRSPNSTNTTTIGTSQYFFSWRRNCQSSDSTRPLLMGSLNTSACNAYGHDGTRDTATILASDLDVGRVDPSRSVARRATAGRTRAK